MRNFIQNGDTVTLTSPYNVASGAPILINSIFGIACHDANIKEVVEVKLTGVFALPKLSSQNFQVGELVYFDDKAKAITTMVAANRLIGVVVEIAGGVVHVRLNGVFGIANDVSESKTPKAT